MMKVLCYKAGERCSVLKDSVSQARVKSLFQFLNWIILKLLGLACEWKHNAVSEIYFNLNLQTFSD